MGNPSSSPRPLIAVMNSSRDLVNVLKSSLEQDGFRTVTLVSTIDDGADAPLAFLRAQQPDATVYAVSPPYKEGWGILQEVRRRWQAGRVVVTTTNVGGLRACVGPAEAIEIIGKPFDLDEITQALRRALAGKNGAIDGAPNGVRVAI